MSAADTASVKRTAILLAGRRPGVDPMAQAEGVALKALIPIAGEPMVARVARTLLAAPEIASIVVLTQDVDVIAAALPADPRIRVERSGAGIAGSVSAVAGGAFAPWPLFVTTADHALLDPQTVSAFLAAVAAAPADIAFGMVERRIVHARFPHNRRTCLKFRGGWWTGANLFALNGEGARTALSLWSEVEQERKKGWKLVARFGPWLLLRALTRTITLQAGVAAAARRIGIVARMIPLADPLAAVDVDKPSDLALVRQVFEGKA